MKNLYLLYDSTGNSLRSICILSKGALERELDNGNDDLVIFPSAHPGHAGSSLGNEILGKFCVFPDACRKTSFEGWAKRLCIVS